MYTEQRGQIEAALRLSTNPGLSAKELASALASGGRATSLTRGQVVIEPPLERQVVSSAPQGRAERGPRWQYTPPVTDRNFAGSLYNVDMPRGHARTPITSAGSLLDSLRERQLLTVDGPVTLGDTVVQNLRAKRARLDGIDVTQITVNGLLEVGREAEIKGGLAVAGGATLGGALEVSGEARHGGDTYNEGNTFNSGTTVHNGPTILNGPVTITNGDGDTVSFTLTPVEVVTEVTWDGTALKTTSQVIYVPRTDGEEIVRTVVEGTDCDTPP